MRSALLGVVFVCLLTLGFFGRVAAADSAGPVFVIAETQGVGAWTGYKADIQVRDLTYSVWPGGFLEDGTFLQNGLVHLTDNGLYTFAYVERPDGTQYESFIKIDPPAGSFIHFEAGQERGRWLLRFRDSVGWHAQIWLQDTQTLTGAVFVVENWFEGAWSTQVMRLTGVRDFSRAWQKPSLVQVWSGVGCSSDLIVGSAPSSLVFKMAPAPCQTYTSIHF